jgi:hypothetical protein
VDFGKLEAKTLWMETMPDAVLGCRERIEVSPIAEEK